MSGLWGFALADPGAKASQSEIGPMVGTQDPVPGAVVLGPAALASQGSAHRLAAAARRTDAGATLGIAIYGSIFNAEEWAELGVSAHTLTEAILERFVREGHETWNRLRGDFAIAIWDGRDGSLHLACDPFRVQPLFYYVDAQKLVFGSRMRMLTNHPRPMRLEIDPNSLVDVLTGSVIPTPHTIYRDVKKLPPGTVLTYRSGTITLRPYWNMRFQPDGKSGARSLAKTLRERLADAVACRLKVDADGGGFGAFLSGGVDSSTVTGLLTRISGHPIQTFSIGFGEPRFNEMDYARIAAQAFGANHHEYFVQPSDVLAAIPILLDAYDEPFANASAIPTYYCAKLAREHGVDVLYAGDGGDELFAGNERYALQRLLDYYHQVPAWVREPLLVPAISALARMNIPGFAQGMKYVQRARVTYPNRLFSYSLFGVLPKDEVLAREILPALSPERSLDGTLAKLYLEANASTPLDRQLYVDLMFAICDNDLFKVTRATEAAEVTVRYPFLDQRLVEFAGTVPAKLKMRGTKLRSFFKDAYSDFLPKATITKTKHGFGLPIPVWLRTDPALNTMMRDLLLGDRSAIAPYFTRSAIQMLVDRHAVDTTSYYGTFLWNLMILELWLLRNSPALHAS